jgi:hypothetical protein
MPNMNYHILEPEVAGGLGEDTVINRRIHPPEVSTLHYKFDGWLGDVLLESFPCFIVTMEAVQKLQGLPATGVYFGDVQATKSVQFHNIYPDRSLPEFRWLKVTGKAGDDDFGLAKDFRLVVSDRVLVALKELRLSNALIENYQPLP